MKELTLETAQSLQGKSIRVSYSGYADQGGHITFKVGEIMSEYDIAKSTPLEGWSNMAEYWESYMKESVLNDRKNTLQILKAGEKPANERQTFIRSDFSHIRGRLPFHLGDSDRFVSFEII